MLDRVEAIMEDLRKQAGELAMLARDMKMNDAKFPLQAFLHSANSACVVAANYLSKARIELIELNARGLAEL